MDCLAVLGGVWKFAPSLVTLLGSWSLVGRLLTNNPLSLLLTAISNPPVVSCNLWTDDANKFIQSPSERQAVVLTWWWMVVVVVYVVSKGGHHCGSDSSAKVTVLCESYGTQLKVSIYYPLLLV